MYVNYWLKCYLWEKSWNSNLILCSILVLMSHSSICDGKLIFTRYTKITHPNSQRIQSASKYVFAVRFNKFSHRSTIFLLYLSNYFAAYSNRKSGSPKLAELNNEIQIHLGYMVEFSVNYATDLKGLFHWARSEEAFMGILCWMEIQ